MPFLIRFLCFVVRHFPHPENSSYNCLIIGMAGSHLLTEKNVLVLAINDDSMVGFEALAI